MPQTKYTFLLPAYKVRYFEEALVSIKNQTFKDFKVIVSDDCSPEDLKSVFDKVVGDDPRFVFRRNEVNMGGKSLVSHWNLLVDLCDTEFLIMASDDDVYESDYLEKIDCLTNKYSDVDLFRGRTKIINEKDELQLNDQLYPEIIDQAHFFSVCFSNCFISCEANYCYRTSVLKSKGGFIDFPSAWFSDDATHIMMASNGCANTSEVVFGFRNSTVSISNSWYNSRDAEKKVEACLLFANWIAEYKSNIVEGPEKMLLSSALTNCRRKIVRNIENNIPMCGCKAFFKLCSRCNKELKLSTPVLFYSWFRIYIRSKVR